MFQQKYRGQTTLKKIRTEPFTFQLEWYLDKRDDSATYRDTLLIRWISSCLNEETVDRSSFGCYCFGEDSKWLFKQMFKRIFERIGISPSHTELGELETEEYRRFALVDPFE